MLRPGAELSKTLREKVENLSKDHAGDHLVLRDLVLSVHPALFDRELPEHSVRLFPLFGLSTRTDYRPQFSLVGRIVSSQLRIGAHNGLPGASSRSGCWSDQENVQRRRPVQAEIQQVGALETEKIRNESAKDHQRHCESVRKKQPNL